MENKNQKSVIIVLSIVIIILMATCMFFATDKINLKKDNKTETNSTEEKENKDNNSTVNASLDKNVVIIENGKIINVKHISSLNFRIAREVLNCSTRVLREVIDIENKSIYKNKIKLCDNVEKCEFSYKYQDSNYIINIEFKSGKVDKTGKNMMTYTIKNGK